MRFSALLAVLSTCFLASSLPAATLQPYKATYSATYFGQTGEATRTLEANSDGSYTTHSNTDINVLFIKFYQHQSSNFRLSTEKQITPLHYQYEGTRDRHATDVKFDWDGNLATNQSSPPWSVKLIEGAQDELSYQEQMRLDLINQREELTYFVTEKENKLDRLRFERVGDETLESPWGKLETIKVKRIRKKGKERKTYFWFAKEWQHLLVRIEHIEGGKGYLVDLKNATINGTEVAPVSVTP